MHIHLIVFELRVMGKKKPERKKEDEENQNFRFGFLDLVIG